MTAFTANLTPAIPSDTQNAAVHWIVPVEREVAKNVTKDARKVLPMLIISVFVESFMD